MCRLRTTARLRVDVRAMKHEQEIAGNYEVEKQRSVVNGTFESGFFYRKSWGEDREAMPTTTREEVPPEDSTK